MAAIPDPNFNHNITATGYLNTTGFVTNAPEQHLLARLLDTLQSAREATLRLDAILGPIPENVSPSKGEQPSIGEIVLLLGNEVGSVAIRLGALKDRLGGYL